MIINKFDALSYRNLNDFEIIPCEGINIIHGENGQGKTNIVEGMWLFTGFKSFRTKRSSELIPYEKDFYKISLEYTDKNREQSITIQSDKIKQEVFKNEVKMISTRSIIGNFLSVVFSPNHLSFIKEGPDERRKFLDIAISQMKPSYAKKLSHYYKVLKERNAVLKNCFESSYQCELIECYNEPLAKLGGQITFERMEYVKDLKESVTNFYDGLSGGKEKLTFEYQQNGREKANTCAEMIESFSEALKKSYENDIKNKYTLKGPHRDDFDICLDGKNIKNFGSQGQQRSAALSMKLGEAVMLQKMNDEMPVVLLDDVMSELDVGRQNYILNQLSSWQVFITCCEPTQVMRMNSGKAFLIKNGKLENN